MNYRSMGILLAAVICLLSLTGLSLKAQWIEDGTPICIAPNNQEYPIIASDGAGGAIISWFGPPAGDFNIYAQRVNAIGDTLWAANGIAVCDTTGVQRLQQMIPDGAGGVFITWEDNRGADFDIYAQRIDAGGNTLWQHQGVLVCDAIDDQERHQLVADGVGGFVVVWEDMRHGSHDIFAQRFTENGTARWNSNGVALSLAAQYQSNPWICSDGVGGAIVVFKDTRTMQVDVYAQRVDSSGTVLWNTNGTAVCTFAEEQRLPRIATDGAGGAIFTWRDQRGLGDVYIYAQRIDADGDTVWAADGIPICQHANGQYEPNILPDGSGGAIIAWEQNVPLDVNIHAQRIDASGALLWSDSGVVVCDVAERQVDLWMVPDGAGGVVIAWEDERATFEDIYAQRLDSDGNRLWSTDGVAVCTAMHEQDHIHMLAMGGGNTMVTWDDPRSLDSDIYVALLNQDGQVVPALLQYYTASYLDGAMAVEWIVSEAIEVDRFEVYRQTSVPSSGWRAILSRIERRGAAYSFIDKSCLPGAQYRYRVELKEETGRRVLFQTGLISVPAQSMALYQNYPNPFNPGTTIRYFLPREAIVDLNIYDSTGRLVRRLVNGAKQQAGLKVLSWDGRGTDGQPAASGIYFYRLKTGQKIITRKMVLLR